jgi:excisionase family DNA binding protein
MEPSVKLSDAPNADTRETSAASAEALELTLRLSPAQLGEIAAAVAELLDGHVSARVEAALGRTRSEDGERLLSVTEVAERVGVSRRTVYRALSGGALVGELVGSRWRVRPDAVASWLRPPPRAPLSLQAAVSRGTSRSAAARSAGGPSARTPTATFTERARRLA